MVVADPAVPLLAFLVAPVRVVVVVVRQVERFLHGEALPPLADGSAQAGEGDGVAGVQFLLRADEISPRIIRCTGHVALGSPPARAADAKAQPLAIMPVLWVSMMRCEYARLVSA